ncbi:MAG TPA: flagellar filament capping protein FliD [Terriglobales bacterium]|nr:flagellar filament capping protein FliD [Terriglobales bacterium]
MSTLPSVNLGSLLSALGNSGTGIDVSSAVSQILQTEAIPQQQWQAQQATLQGQTSAINSLESLVSALQTSLQGLGDPGGSASSMSATSSNTAIVTATAAPGTATGNHVVVVKNVATTGAWYSDSVANSTTALAAGSFDIQVGSNAPVTITVGSGVNTLSDLATAINGQHLGVTASVINDSTGSRLALVSTASGTANDFTISNDSSVGFTQAVQGKDASLTVDGIPISSASNSVTGAVNGLTLNLVSGSENTEVNVAVAPNSDQISQAVSSFVSAYNAVIQNVNSQFAFDQTSNTAGTLAGDGTVRMLQDALLGSGSYSSTGGTISTLGQLGISMNNDGTLTLDSSTLNNAIQTNFSAVQNFFQGTAANGFAATLNTQLSSFTDPIDGAFTVELQSISSENSDLQDQIDDFQTYLNSEQTRLTNEYNQIDATLQQLPILEKQVAAELGQNTSGNS